MRLQKPVDKICQECGQPFKAYKRTTIYCGDACYKKVYARKNKYILADKRVAKTRAKKFALTQSPLYAPIV